MYGVIDIGSNTIRLVVYRVQDGSIQKMMNKKYMVGLASYVDDDGVMSQEGVDRLVEVLQELEMLTRSIVLEELYVFATASLRNLVNTEEAVEAAYRATGWHIQVLTGEEEARYDFDAMVHEAGLHSGMVADIGGGSTELVFFLKDEVKGITSLPVGSLNQYRRHVGKILPKPSEVHAICKYVRNQLDRVHKPKRVPSDVLCCEGGTARAAKKLINSKYPDAFSDQGYDSKYLARFLNYYSEDEKGAIQMFLKICPERIHTIVPGMLILQEIVDEYGCEYIRTLESGVREGYLWSKLKESATEHV